MESWASFLMSNEPQITNLWKENNNNICISQGFCEHRLSIIHIKILWKLSNNMKRKDIVMYKFVAYSGDII